MSELCPESSSKRINFLNRLKIFHSNPMTTSKVISSGNTIAANQHKHKPGKMIILPVKCHIKSVQGELMREITIHKHHTGQYLLSNLREALNLSDTKCFGLKIAGHIDDQEDLVKSRWIDLTMSVYKQIKELRKLINVWQDDDTKETHCVVFYLRLKFYPPNHYRIDDLFTKNYLWLQLRRDLRVGKLTSTYNNMAILAACVLQFEFGNYSDLSTMDKNQYCSRIQILPNQKSIERLIIQIHQTELCDMTAQQAQLHFLQVAVTLETYGFDYYPVRDHQKQRGMLLGFNYAGIKTIRNGRVLHHFKWHSIRKITYERRMIILHTSTDNKKQIIGFKCPSLNDCNNLYHRLLEQRYFFTVDLVSFEACLKRSCLRQSISTDQCRILSRQSLHCSSPNPIYPRCRDYPYSYNTSNNSDYNRDSANRYDHEERATSSSSNAHSARSRLTNTMSEQSLIGGLHNHTLRRFQAKLQRQHSVFFADSRATSPVFVDYQDIDEPVGVNYYPKHYQSSNPDQEFANKYQDKRTNLSPAGESISTMSSMPSRTLSFSQISQLSNDDCDPALINCFISDDSSSGDTSEGSSIRRYLLLKQRYSSRKQNIVESVLKVDADISNKTQSRCWTINIDQVKQCSKYVLAKIWFPIVFTSRRVYLLVSRGHFKLRTIQYSSFSFVTQKIRHIAMPLRSMMINSNEANSNHQIVNMMKLGVIILLFQMFCVVTRPLFDLLFDKLF